VKTVKEVAELSGVTVRTLHHYDRLYSHADLERLQEILGWRALGDLA
jgi:DNA-binding transcriptional MerR regulator